MGGQPQKLYHKRVVITLAIFQILALSVFVAESTVALYMIKEDEDSGDFSDLPARISAHDVKVGRAINLGLAGFTLILDFVELVCFAINKLKPVLFISSACLKTILWAALLGLTIASISSGNWLGILLTVVICLTSLFQLCYASRIRRQLRSGDLKTIATSAADVVESALNQEQSSEGKNHHEHHHKHEQVHNQVKAEAHQHQHHHHEQSTCGWGSSGAGFSGGQHHGGGHGGHH